MVEKETLDSSACHVLTELVNKIPCQPDGITHIVPYTRQVILQISDLSNLVNVGLGHKTLRTWTSASVVNCG